MQTGVGYFEPGYLVEGIGPPIFRHDWKGKLFSTTLQTTVFMQRNSAAKPFRFSPSFICKMMHLLFGRLSTQQYALLKHNGKLMVDFLIVIMIQLFCLRHYRHTSLQSEFFEGSGSH